MWEKSDQKGRRDQIFIHFLQVVKHCVKFWQEFKNYNWIHLSYHKLFVWLNESKRETLTGTETIVQKQSREHENLNKLISLLPEFFVNYPLLLRGYSKKWSLMKLWKPLWGTITSKIAPKEALLRRVSTNRRSVEGLRKGRLRLESNEGGRRLSMLKKSKS